MRFKQYIGELFTVDIPVKVMVNSKIEFITEWYIGEQEYNFTALHSSMGKSMLKDSWEINFMARGRASYGERVTMDARGTLAVFSAVKKSFNLFVKAKDPNLFWFAPSNRKLKKIYDRFVKEILTKGYKRKISKKDPLYYIFYKVFK